MAGSRFAYVICIRTTTQKLWRALTDPEFTRRYWMQTSQDCQWRPGDTWRLMAPDGRIVDSGQVLEVEPQRRLVLAWCHQLMPEMRDEGDSRMVYELETHGDSIKLTVTHEMERPDSKLIEAVSTGWPMILSSLKSLLETGEPLEMTRRWPEHP